MKDIIVLTGASGFVGKHLAKKLIDFDYNIVAITRPGNLNEKKETERIKWITLDDLESAVNGYTVKACIHLATNYGRNSGSAVEQYNCNVMLPLILLEWSKIHGVQKFIFTDSFFGKYENTYNYMKQYIITKRHFYEVACETIKGFDIGLVNMRLEHVYGEGDGEGKFIPTILGKMRKHENILCTHGLQKRDFIYIDDVTDAYLKVLDYDMVAGYREYQVGTGQSKPLRAFIEQLKKESNSHSEIEYGAIPIRDDEILDSKANNLTLRQIGWEPCFDIQEGIKKMLSFTNE